MATALLRRDQVDARFTWALESLFDSTAAWEQSYAQVESLLPGLSSFQGRIGEAPALLLEWMERLHALRKQLEQIYIYASMERDIDTADQAASARYERVRGLFARFQATTAFGDTEILALGSERLAGLLAQEPRLALYAHAFDSLERLRAHVRSAEVETLLGQASDALRSTSIAHALLADAELEFGSVVDASGESLEVAQGTITRLLTNPERAVRQAAWERYADGHLRFKNTLASCIAGGFKSNVFYAQARGYSSALEAATAASHLPVAVFDNVIETYKRHLPVWQRYWAVRRKALGVSSLHTYDLWAPLTSKAPHVPFEQAMEWICAGMAPLGDEYVEVMRRGVLEQRWVDRYPNRGKRSGAYSTGVQGTHPFILMSYNNSLLSMSTLAHELGHSLHSYFSWQHQPFIYSDYSTFVAEVASNFNQALVRAYLLRTHAQDTDFQISVIEEAMSNFLRYFFIMPNLARFEHAAHSSVERGEALTADSMSTLMAGLYREGYGAEAVVDEQRDGITWAEFSTHLYSNFYVFQYATGIAAANALASEIVAGDQQAAQRYLAFLKAGSSAYPLDALRLAGVDLLSPEPIERAFKVMSDYIDRLETLIAARG